MDKDAARDLIQQVPERVREWRPERALDALPQRAVDLLPDAAQERLGRKRRRPRWLLIGVVAGLAAGGIWLGLKLKRVLAPGYDDYDEDEEPLGEPLSYPAAGSGSGWPEGARSPENTEILSASAAPAPLASSPPAPPPVPPAPPTVASPHLASGGASAAGETGRLSADVPAAPSAPSGFERSQDLDATIAFPAPPAAAGAQPANPTPGPAGAVWAEGQDVAPAPPSEPAQRPPIPFTEGQAEMNARLQLQQDALYAEFPGMTRTDIVESDGDLDRLSVILATKLGRQIDEVHGKIEAILATGATQQQENSGIEPDLSVRED